MKFTDMKSAIAYMKAKTAIFGDDCFWNVAAGVVQKFEKNVASVTITKKETVSVHFKTACKYDYMIFRFSDGRYRGCNYCSRFEFKREATEVHGFVDFMYTWKDAYDVIKSLL